MTRAGSDRPVAEACPGRPPSARRLPLSRPTWCRAAIALAAWTLALGLAPRPAVAQFGQNKVQYRRFDWHILQTEHFNVHYYTQERDAALDAARMAERSYTYLSDFFQHEITDKIPLILYSNHQDFEQSNVIGGFISEGTGGVTESLKGRVTLPLTGSYAELNHVLTHELVHAFQYDMQKRNVRGMLGLGPLPLWMIEGMAEWVSNGMDPVTAMWVMDAVRRKELPTVEKMAGMQDIRVYRMGQALYDVIGKSYGRERVRRILKRPEPPRGAWRDSMFTSPSQPALPREPDPNLTDSLAFAPGSHSGASLEKRWRTYADSLAKELAQGLVKPDSVAERVTKVEKYERSFHLAPALSPDGSRILYYSSRGFHNELFIAERDGKAWKQRQLVSGEETPELESLPLLSASADWSPDGKQVVFVATQQGKDEIKLFDVDQRKIVRSLQTELFSISNPVFSPDGRYVLFSALEGGQEDLFLIEVQTKRLIRLTQDAYAERTPRFSPDGRSIVFAGDRGQQTRVGELVFGPWNLTLIHLHDEGGEPVAGPEEVLLESRSNDFAPVWSPDGSQVAFVSDRDGTHQVYTLDVATGQVRKRTRFDAGVVGIIPTGPAISWSKNGTLAFSVFQNGGWGLFRADGFPEDLPGDYDERRMQMTRSAPKELSQPAPVDVVQHDNPYRARLSPEYAVLGALYVGNAGAAGSGQLLLGDMLGNHYVLVGGNLRSNLDESELLVQYANLGHRWQWGISGYQFRDDIGFLTAPDRGTFRTLIRRGVGGQLAYPFNRFRRVELGVEVQTVSQQTAEVLFSNGDTFVQPGAKERFYYALPGLALVNDTAAWSGFTPVAGSRWRTEVDRAFGDIGFTFGLLDYRRYLNIKTRGAFAFRVVGAASTGSDPQILRIGGPDSFRGSDFGGLVGTRAVFTNWELRFPVIPSTELLRGIVFVDAATAWEDDRALKLGRPGGPLGVQLQDLEMAYGVGVRGYIGIPLRFDAAVPTDLKRTGNWITTFSIGFDF